MLAWMIYVMAVTLLLGAAALAAERRARLRRAPSRWLWASAIAASLMLPTVIASVSIQLPSIVDSEVPRKMIALREVTSVSLSPGIWMPRRAASVTATRSVDVALQRGWVLLSAVMLFALITGGAHLSWRKRRWDEATACATPVYLAADVGPAVVGLMRPRIVLPKWFGQLPASAQEAIIAHERSHLDAHDPQLLTLALFLLVLMPWNLPLWWQLIRLRRAMEVDCDARVIQRGHDATRYGETLLVVGQRQSAFVGAVAGMSEPRSFLEERLKLMMRKPTKEKRLAATVLGCLALALVAAAAEVGPPNAAPSSQEGAPLDLDSAVLDRYVGDYRLAPSLVLSVTREGTQLFAQLTGQPRAKIFAKSDSEFFYKIVQAQISFQVDARGQTTGLVLHQNGRNMDAPRIDAAAAQKIVAANEAKLKNQTATPGSEAALRRLIQGLLTDKPNYSEMSPELAQAVRDQLPKLEAGMKQLGAVQSVEFRGVGSQGWDLYEVRQERGLSEWKIALGDNGIIAGALVSNGP